MKYGIYSVRDNKVGFGAPFVDISDQTAIRGFAFAVNQKVEVMSFAPQDYDLYRVGSFDTEKGEVVPENVPQFIASGTSLITNDQM